MIIDRGWAPTFQVEQIVARGDSDVDAVLPLMYGDSADAGLHLYPRDVEAPQYVSNGRENAAEAGRPGGLGGIAAAAAASPQGESVSPGAGQHGAPNAAGETGTVQQTGTGPPMSKDASGLRQAGEVQDPHMSHQATPCKQPPVPVVKRPALKCRASEGGARAGAGDEAHAASAARKSFGPQAAGQQAPAPVPIAQPVMVRGMS